MNCPSGREKLIGIDTSPVNGLEATSLGDFDGDGVRAVGAGEKVRAVGALDSGGSVASELGALVAPETSKLGAFVSSAPPELGALDPPPVVGASVSSALGALLSMTIVGTTDKLGDLVKAAVGGVTIVGGFDSSMVGTTVEVVSGDGVDGGKVSVSGVVALPVGINVGNVVMGADVGEAVTVASVGEEVSLMAVMSDVVALVGVDVPG